MRAVVLGAGAVGGVIGGRLHQKGLDVTLIARGEHLAALQRDGLRLIDGFEDVTLPIAAVGDPAEVDWQPGDIAIVTTKTQDVEVAFDQLRAAAPEATVLVATNGVDAERMALRRFADVVGVCVALPGTFLDPGVVLANSSPVSGMLQLGRFPDGADDRVSALAEQLDGPGLAWRAVDNISQHKYGKLLMNLGNVLDAMCSREARESDIAKRATAEARAVFAKMSIDPLDNRAGWPEGFAFRPTVTGDKHRGSSTWQSLTKGARLEVDFLNGEVVLLGRLHGVPTPVNAMLQQLGTERHEPRSVSLENLNARLGT